MGREVITNAGETGDVRRVEGRGRSAPLFFFSSSILFNSILHIYVGLLGCLTDERLERALLTLPRSEFFPDNMSHLAHENGPGTLSSPSLSLPLLSLYPPLLYL